MSAQGDDLAPAYGANRGAPQPQTRELFPVQMGPRSAPGGVVNPHSALDDVREPSEEELAAIEAGVEEPPEIPIDAEVDGASEASAEGNENRAPSKP